jgi:hypothetical protein
MNEKDEVYQSLNRIQRYRHAYQTAFLRGFLYGAFVGSVVSGLIWRFAR